MNALTYLGYPPFKVIKWIKRNEKVTVQFGVIDSKDNTKLTVFTLLLNNEPSQYEVLADGSISVNVYKNRAFTLKITNADGYVDTATNTYTFDLLNGSLIGLTKKTVGENAEFKLDWNIEIARDLDSHMVIKNSANEEIGHVFYGEQTFSDSTTTVTLDYDNVTRQGDLPPEVMSITKINPEYTYYYYVHDYSETGLLPKTNLNLNVVLLNETVEPSMTIPTEDNPNSFWNVCAIKGTQLFRASDYMEKTVTDSPNTSYKV